MNNTTKALLSVSIIGLFFGAATTFADGHNPLLDASFEDQVPAEQGGWGRFEQSKFSDDQARTGSHSMYNGGLSKTVAYHPYFIGSVSGSFQEFPAEPGSQWRLTGYGMAVAKLLRTPAFGVVQISFFDADGNDLGTEETVGATARALTSNEVNNQSPAGEWIFLDTGAATAPAGTATIQAFTIYVDFSGSNTAQGVYFDDLVLCNLESEGCDAD